MYICIYNCIINNGNRTEWSPVQSVITWFAKASKSPWKLTNCWISLKRPWIFHRSPWLSLKAPSIKMAFVKKKKTKKKKTCFAQRNDWKQGTSLNRQIFLGDHESVFLWFCCSWHSSFSVIWSTYPFNLALMKEGTVISEPPSTYTFLRSLVHVIGEKKSLQKWF